MIPHDPFERRFPDELTAHRPEPGPELRARVLRVLEREPLPGAMRGRAAGDELVPDLCAGRAARTLPRLCAALAASLLVLVALHAGRADRDALPEVAERAARPRAWNESLEGGAAELEAQLLAQANLLAADARRVAASFLERVPSAPWDARSDGEASPSDTPR